MRRLAPQRGLSAASTRPLTRSLLLPSSLSRGEREEGSSFYIFCPKDLGPMPLPQRRSGAFASLPWWKRRAAPFGVRSQQLPPSTRGLYHNQARLRSRTGATTVMTFRPAVHLGMVQGPKPAKAVAAATAVQSLRRRYGHNQPRRGQCARNAETPGADLFFRSAVLQSSQSE